MSKEITISESEKSSFVTHQEDVWGNDREVKDYVERIARKVRRKCSSEMDLDDLIALGYIGILQSRKTYDVSKGFTWKQHAYWRTYGAMVDGARQWSHHSHCRTLVKRDQRRSNSNDSVGIIMNMVPFPGDDNELGLGDSTVYEGNRTFILQDQFVIEQDLVRKIAWIATKLPLEERVILELYYHFEMSMKDIGSLFGHTKSWVSRKHARAVDALQQALSSVDIDPSHSPQEG